MKTNLIRNLIVISLFAPTFAFSGELRQFSAGPNCTLKKFVDKKWVPADESEVSGSTFEVKPSAGSAYSSFKHGGVWYTSKSDCFSKADGSSSGGGSHAYRTAGCGLGSMLFKDPGITQIFAATTNGTFGNQTFGISTGTLGCSKAGGVANRDAEQNMYIATNRDVIIQETAQGSGEHLNALASVMGCEKSSDAAFAATLKKNYKTVASEESTEKMLKDIKNVISSDAALAHSCKG